jgi:hypothetical protein
MGDGRGEGDRGMASRFSNISVYEIPEGSGLPGDPMRVVSWCPWQFRLFAVTFAVISGLRQMREIREGTRVST